MQTCQTVSLRARFSGWMGLVLIGFLIFNGAMFSAETAFSARSTEDVSKRDFDSETTDASRQAKEKLDGATSGITGIFTDIKNWFVGIYTGFDNWMKGVFGFDRGEGTEAFFGSIIYFFLILVFLFVGKFVYNIFAGLFKYKGGRSRER